ncbi:hypothetical protein [Acinetobacter sp. CE-15]|uniref:hypothetical protein n=1 Tax=Acinetobacter sp. CE-15 TaxID=3425693 RepID=UPI003DA1D2D9
MENTLKIKSFEKEYIEKQVYSKEITSKDYFFKDLNTFQKRLKESLCNYGKEQNEVANIHNWGDFEMSLFMSNKKRLRTKKYVFFIKIIEKNYRMNRYLTYVHMTGYNPLKSNGNYKNAIGLINILAVNLEKA